MTVSPGSLRARWFVVLGCGFVVLAIALVFYVFSKHQWAAQLLSDVEPRYGRMLGLQGQAAPIAQAEQQVMIVLGKYAYPSSQDATQAGNDAQQRLRDVFTKAGLEIVSSQVLPSKPEKVFDRIPLSVRAEGELSALQGAFVVMATIAPAVLIDSVALQSVGLVRADQPQRIAVQLELSALKIRP